MKEQIWFKDPSILFSKDTFMKFTGNTTAESLNSIVRIVIYVSVVTYMFTLESKFLLLIPIVLLFTYVLYNLYPNGKQLEAFFNSKPDHKTYTMPTKENPFMNVLLTDIMDDPNRSDAAPTSRHDVKRDIYKQFQKTSDMYMDTSDLFDQTQAMRTFHTMQSATVPNDLDGFKKWLSKGLEEPDYSSAPPARHAKILNEGYVHAKGSMKGLSSSTSKPSGTVPAPSTTSK
jgi:hypothetical protein